MTYTENDALAAKGTSPNRVAAFFDVDETLIRGSSSFILAQELWRRGIVGWADIAAAAKGAWKYVLFGEDKEEIDALVQRALKCLEGHSEAEIIAIGEEIYDQFFASRIFPRAKELLEAHRGRGHDVWLISATPSQITDLLARRLGATGGIGTRVALDENGRCLPRLISPLMHGAGKVGAVHWLARKRNIDLSLSYAYSDSANDLPLLRAVGHPAAINPDPKLRLAALASGWRIYDMRWRKRGDLSNSAKKTAKRSAKVAAAIWLTRLVVRQLRRILR